MSVVTRQENCEPLFPFMYEAHPYEIATFGGHWIGPVSFKPWEETLVAHYQKPEGGDGQSVDVYCTAAPDRFYRLDVYSELNSIGEPQPAYKVATGSSAHQLAADLAKAIAEGMISFEVKP